MRAPNWGTGSGGQSQGDSPPVYKKKTLLMHKIMTFLRIIEGAGLGGLSPLFATAVSLMVVGGLATHPDLVCVDDKDTFVIHVDDTSINNNVFKRF